jgi:hypothetical protein
MESTGKVYSEQIVLVVLFAPPLTSEGVTNTLEYLTRDLQKIQRLLRDRPEIIG